MPRLIQVGDDVADAWSSIPESDRLLLTGPVLRALIKHAAALEAWRMAEYRLAQGDPETEDLAPLESEAQNRQTQARLQLDAMGQAIDEAILAQHAELAEGLE